MDGMSNFQIAQTLFTEFKCACEVHQITKKLSSFLKDKHKLSVCEDSRWPQTTILAGRGFVITGVDEGTRTIK
jgi:hypothetical protein